MGEVNTIKSTEIFELAKELLKAGKTIRLTVTGNSMYPFLRENIDNVELCYKDFSQIYRGDIVLIIRENNEYVLHRVIKKVENNFYIAGDAQQWIEGPLASHQLIASVSTVWRNNRKLECSSIYWKILSSSWLRLLHFRYFIIKCYANVRKLI